MEYRFALLLFLEFHMPKFVREIVMKHVNKILPLFFVLLFNPLYAMKHRIGNSVCSQSTKLLSAVSTQPVVSRSLRTVSLAAGQHTFDYTQNSSILKKNCRKKYSSQKTIMQLQLYRTYVTDSDDEETDKIYYALMVDCQKLKTFLELREKLTKEPNDICVCEMADGVLNLFLGSMGTYVGFGLGDMFCDKSETLVQCIILSPVLAGSLGVLAGSSLLLYLALNSIVIQPTKAVAHELRISSTNKKIKARKEILAEKMRSLRLSNPLSEPFYRHYSDLMSEKSEDSLKAVEELCKSKDAIMALEGNKYFIV